MNVKWFSRRGEGDSRPRWMGWVFVLALRRCRGGDEGQPPPRSVPSAARLSRCTRHRHRFEPRGLLCIHLAPVVWELRVWSSWMVASSSLELQTFAGVSASISVHNSVDDHICSFVIVGHQTAKITFDHLSD